MRRLIMRLTRAAVNGYDFIRNVHYYWIDRGYPLRAAIHLARRTL